MIKVTDLSKNFGELKALDKVSFSVPKGSIFGLVGANGAGKSTLMRIIAGIYTADDGSVLINDEPVYDNPAAKTHLVFVPDRMHLTGAGQRSNAWQIFMLHATPSSRLKSLMRCSTFLSSIKNAAFVP